MDTIRVLILDDDNHTPSYHAEDTSCWGNANQFIKWLTRPHTTIIPYEVREVRLIELEPPTPDIDTDMMFDIVNFHGRGYSFKEYQEAFNVLWELSEPI